MGAGAQPTLRIPLILLALVNLAILGSRLWPWQQVLNLPGNGATGIDPVVCLVAYAVLIFFIGGNRDEPIRKALSAGALLGLLAGFILVAQVLLKTQFAGAVSFHPRLLRVGFLALAGVVWGFAGLRGARAGGNAGIGMLSGLWSAMVSGLMACTAVLAQWYFAAAAVPETTDPWRQYEGLAIGNPATQALVNSLTSATWFLLVVPLAGTALGLLFAFFGQTEES
jgi:hypothetical protein